MTLGLHLTRAPPKQGTGLVSCAVDVDAAQRTGTISSVVALLGGGVKAGAAAALGGESRLLQSYSLGCEVGSAAAGAVSARCDGTAGAAPSALTMSVLAPPVALDAGGRSLSLAAEVTLGGAEGGRGVSGRVGVAVPLVGGVRAKATADSSGRCSCHLLLNEGGFGPWRRGARGLPPAFAVGATMGAAAAQGDASAGGGVGAADPAVSLGFHMLRLVGERAVVLPAALSAAPLLVSID